MKRRRSERGQRTAGARRRARTTDKTSAMKKYRSCMWGRSRGIPTAKQESGEKDRPPVGLSPSNEQKDENGDHEQKSRDDARTTENLHISGAGDKGENGGCVERQVVAVTVHLVEIDHDRVHKWFSQQNGRQMIHRYMSGNMKSCRNRTRRVNRSTRQTGRIKTA